MEPAKLNDVLDVYLTIEALLNEGQFPGKYAAAIVRCRAVIHTMHAALAAKIKEESNEGNRDSQDAPGVASGAAGSGRRKSRKRKSN